MKVAAIQLISGPQVEPNLITTGQLIDQAVEDGANLVALPEYFPMIGASDSERLAVREIEGKGPIQEFLAAKARQHGLWIVGGSLPLHAHDGNKLRNTCLVFDPLGNHAARYDKIHLFSFHQGTESYDEAKTIEPGVSATHFDLKLDQEQWRIGVGICYDLRFPELFRAMGPLDLLVLPAAFTETTGRAHWEILLRARAIENQCYVLASAQGGRHPNGRMTHGNSMLIDPWGEIVMRMDKGEGIVAGEMSKARLSEIRTKLPALQHRKL
jgi:deaminated glutathione amidase